jgi:hypothetical protein
MGFLKTAVSKWLGLSDAPLKPITDNEELQKLITTKLNTPNTDMREFWLWYTANAFKLTNYYAARLRDRAKKDYFYARSAYEENKKTHSGLPKSMVDTISNVTGVPIITVSVGEDLKKNEEMQNRIDEIIEFNDFKNIVKQDARPKTLVIGGGAFFVSNLSHVNEGLDKPIIEFVDERFCDIETIGNVFVSATKKTVYKKGEKKYTHFERRSYNKIENWIIDDKDNRVTLQTLPETAELEDEIILDIDDIPAVPCRYKNGHSTYGLSIYEGKVDLFDDYDQTTSQLAELVRKSTPVDYLPAELLPKIQSGPHKGEPLAPTTFDRKFIVLQKSMRQDTKEEIETKQASLDFLSIIEAGKDQLTKIFNGIISPASLGLNVAADSSGESIREKERVTFNTRDDIIDNERGVVKRVMELTLKIDDLMNKRAIGQDYDVHVDYPDFSAPTFDKMIQTLLPMWAQDGISPEKFVELLYTDTMTDEEKEREIEYLKGSKEKVVDYNIMPNQDNLDFEESIEKEAEEELEA